jgi:hypothetical protein
VIWTPLHESEFSQRFLRQNVINAYIIDRKPSLARTKTSPYVTPNTPLQHYHTITWSLLTRFVHSNARSYCVCVCVCVAVMVQPMTSPITPLFRCPVTPFSCPPHSPLHPIAVEGYITFVQLQFPYRNTKLLSCCCRLPLVCLVCPFPDLTLSVSLSPISVPRPNRFKKRLGFSKSRLQTRVFKKPGFCNIWLGLHNTNRLELSFWKTQPKIYSSFWKTQKVDTPFN